jgi:hypothetical protein
MADEKPKYPHRDYRGTKGAIEDAEGDGKREGLKTGRHGASTPGSPKKWPAPRNEHTGSEGEKAYGPPMTTPEERGD